MALSLGLSVCVCVWYRFCKCSDQPQSEIVKLVKMRTGATTLSIGDGANDVVRDTPVLEKAILSREISQALYPV
jgi:hypothetical protein